MSKLRRLQFSLRTLLLAVLVLAVTSWLVARYLKWHEDQVWTAFYAAVQDRDQAITTWRRLHAVREDTRSWKQAEADSRNRYFSAKQTIDEKLEMMRSYCDESSEKLQQAQDIRDGRWGLPVQAGKLPANHTK